MIVFGLLEFGNGSPCAIEIARFSMQVLGDLLFGHSVAFFYSCFHIGRRCRRIGPLLLDSYDQVLLRSIDFGGFCTF